MPQHCSLSESKIRTIYQPPSILLQITEGSINNTCKKLSPCDEEGIDRDQSTSQVGWRNLSDVHGHCHGSKACREEPKQTWDIRANTLTHAGIKHTHIDSSFHSTLDSGYHMLKIFFVTDMGVLHISKEVCEVPISEYCFSILLLKIIYFWFILFSEVLCSWSWKQ